MLPGFRFLFAAIALSMSILVFGLGAAALLRAAHEEFASTPSWHTPPEMMFAQQGAASSPVLAMLRVDAPAAEKAPDNVPAVTAPPVAATALAESDRIAALQPADSPTPATSEIPVAEHPPQVETAPAQDETAAPQAAAPAAADETRVAATTATTEQVSPPASETAPAAQAVPAAEAAPASPEPAATPSSTDAETFSTKIATLGGPPVAIELAAKAADPKLDKSGNKKRDQAKRVHRRRRIALVAAQTQPADPFATPVATPARPRKPR